IGRGAQGRPWVLAQVSAALHGSPAPKIPQGADFIQMVCTHYEAMLSFYGADLGRKVARKHLGWYMDDARTEPALRKAILTHANPADVLRDLPDALDMKVAA
ncbi:MAG: tRNA-dihydrouridine synthase, partial [Pseudomonadota bacterium]